MLITELASSFFFFFDGAVSALLFLGWHPLPPSVQVSSVVTNESPSYVRNVLMPPGECSHLTNLRFNANKTDMDHEPPSAPPPSLSLIVEVAQEVLYAPRA
jgi:hypothetical protein